MFFQLLQVDDNAKLGCMGADSIKTHPWFKDMD